MIEIDGGPTSVALGEEAVWVVLNRQNAVARIDPVSAQIDGEPIPVGEAPLSAAAGAGDVWVANMFGDTVTRIDPEKNEVVGKPIRVGDGPMAIAVSEDGAYVFNALDGTVTRIDIKTGKVLSTSPRVVGRAAGNPDFAGIAAADGAVWVVSPSEGTVVRLDAKTNKPVGEPIQVGSGPVSVAADEDSRLGRQHRRRDGHPHRPGDERGRRRADRARGIARLGGGRRRRRLGRDHGGNGDLDRRRVEPGRRSDHGRRKPSGIAYGDGVLWAADVFNGTVMRIEP